MRLTRSNSANIKNKMKNGHTTLEGFPKPLKIMVKQVRKISM